LKNYDLETFLIGIEYMDREKRFWNEIIQSEIGIYEDGREDGKEEGRIEGRIDGEQKGIEKVARNMKLQNVDYNVIANFTGLSIDEIEKL